MCVCVYVQVNRGTRVRRQGLLEGSAAQGRGKQRVSTGLGSDERVVAGPGAASSVPFLSSAQRRNAVTWPPTALDCALSSLCHGDCLCLPSNACQCQCQCLVSSASRLPRAPTFALRWLRLDPPLPTRFRAAKATTSDTHWLSTLHGMPWHGMAASCLLRYRRPPLCGIASSSPRRVRLAGLQRGSGDVSRGLNNSSSNSIVVLNTLAAETAIVYY